MSGYLGLMKVYLSSLRTHEAIINSVTSVVVRFEVVYWDVIARW